MKIIIVSALAPPEPVVSANLSKDIALALSENYDVTVIRPKQSRPYGFNFREQILPNYPFEHVTVSSFISPKSSLVGRFKESFSFGVVTARFIKNNRDNIGCIYANTWPLFAQYFAVRAAKKYKRPIILHVQDIYPESLVNKLPYFGPLVNFLLRPMDSWILKNATKVISISEKMKAYLVKTRKIDPSKIEVVVNWQNEETFFEYPTSESSTDKNAVFTFMYLGNIGPVAGCELLIDAFAKLRKQGTRLVIAGSGSMKESLFEKVKRDKIDGVEFWSVPDGEVPSIQAKADVMLLPVKKGLALMSIPSKLPAYMFSAKPIIASVDADSDTANAINESGCGWLVEPDNAFQLANAMEKACDLSSLERKTLGLNGRNYALREFGKDTQLKKLVNIILKHSQTN